VVREPVSIFVQLRICQLLLATFYGHDVRRRGRLLRNQLIEACARIRGGGLVELDQEPRSLLGTEPLFLSLRGLRDLFGGNYPSPPCLDDLMRRNARFPVRFAPPARSVEFLANRTGCLYYL
jgi:hypothetical protein